MLLVSLLSLRDRKQYVVVNDAKSDTSPITCGVPQGSVLGPLLFLLYVNDIHCCVQKENCIRLFADDTNIFISGNNIIELRNEGERILESLYKWFSVNKLTMNIDKTCFSIFTTQRNHEEIFSTLTFGTHTIQRVQSAKYLGVILDDKLNWNEHIENVLNNIVKYLNCFKYIRKHIPTNCARILYYSFIYPRISYGIEIYGKTSKLNINKLQIMQNKCLKILLNLHPRTSTNYVHKLANVLKVSDISEYVTINFVHRQLNGNLPPIYNNYFVRNSQIHHYATRQSSHLYLPQPNSQHGHKMTKFMGPLLWNSLPGNLREITNNERFKKELKQFYINNYEL